MWKVVTGPMDSEQALSWVYTSTCAGIFGKNTNWGLYTKNDIDAYNMAFTLGGLKEPVFDLGGMGQYNHYHVNSRTLFGKYKHFHIWFGEMYTSPVY